MIRFTRLLLTCLVTVTCALAMTLTFFTQAFAHLIPNVADPSLQFVLPMYSKELFFLSIVNYIWQGMLHIFIGIDHVLFVTCLTLAVGWSGRILWSVTGFTLGHSVTLALGAFGFAPHGLWFAPMIEVIIALSILCAAVIVLQNVWKERKEAIDKAKWSLFGVAGLIGLVHGYGFSFAFEDVLNGSTQQITTALAGFNIGVEIGQFIIIAMVMAAVAGGKWLWKEAPKWMSSSIAAGTIAIACVWIVERALVLHGTLLPTFS